jgi:lipopolysaccharide/colanic/teichoic acid biosynthesis glycosyltransferase
MSAPGTRVPKRAFDIVAASAGLVILAPLLGVLAALVRAHDGGPVWFRQVRVGRGGVPFSIWKFRTMIPDSEGAGPAVTAGGDPRITPIGARLRRWKLDELPQLLNVLAGEMSLVGPRPEVPRFVAAYSAAERPLLDHLPGLTDPAALAYRAEEALLAAAADPERVYIERIMPDKARISLEYAARATVRSDIGVLAGTVASLLRPARRRAAALHAPT